jgi:hypothetical protein
MNGPGVRIPKKTKAWRKVSWRFPSIANRVDLAQIPLSVLSTARKHIAQPKASSSSVDRVSEARAKLAELRRRKGKLNDDGDDDDEAHRQSTSWSSRSSKHA